MELSYREAIADIDHYRSIGANDGALDRTEGVINHCFIMMSKYSELEHKCESLQAQVLNLREQLFGAAKRPAEDQSPNEQTESQFSTDNSDTTPTSNNTEEPESKPPPNGEAANDDAQASSDESKPPAPGHGRLGADSYTGAIVVECKHDELKAGDTCPKCESAKIYNIDPNKRIVIDGQSPFIATCYVMEVLRCALCGALFHGQAPVDVKQKYTIAMKAVLIYLHYGMGLTYYGIARMQLTQGAPIPLSTQSELVESAAGPTHAIFNHLRAVAKESNLIVQDDTNVRIIELIRENAEQLPERKGMYTTGLEACFLQPAIVQNMAVDI